MHQNFLFNANSFFEISQFFFSNRWLMSIFLSTLAVPCFLEWMVFPVEYFFFSFFRIWMVSVGLRRFPQTRQNFVAFFKFPNFSQFYKKGSLLKLTIFLNKNKFYGVITAIHPKNYFFLVLNMCAFRVKSNCRIIHSSKQDEYWLVLCYE